MWRKERHDQLQTKWMAKGCKWHSKVTPPPVGWNPDEQVKGLDNLNATEVLYE